MNSRRWILLLSVLTLVGGALAFSSKQWCRINGWATPDVHIHMCYSDFAQLFGTRGLAEGYFPFTEEAGQLGEDQWLEYPVLMALIAGATAWLVPGSGDGHKRTLAFFDINSALVLCCWVGVVLATAATLRHRSHDAAWVALSPALILTAFINWDLWAVILASLALLAWARGRPLVCGALLGLGAAVKLYPLFFFGAILVLCLRRHHLRPFITSLAAGVVTWLAVNLPFMMTAFDQWSTFYIFSSEREVSFSSMWLTLAWTDMDGATFSWISNGFFGLCCLGILWLGMKTPQRPDMAQLCLLIVAAFILLGKVYSPQFVIWLVPLVILARPVGRQFWIWQAAEVYHWVGVWLESARITAGGQLHLAGTGDWWITAWYTTGIIAHMATLLWICASVIADLHRPAAINDPDMSSKWERPAHLDAEPKSHRPH